MAHDSTTRRKAIQSIGAGGAVALAGCLGGGGSSDDPETSEQRTATGTDESGAETVRAAFVHEAAETSTWVARHKSAARNMAEEYDWLEVSFQDEVAAADAQQVFTNYADQGYDVIFGNAFAYQDPLRQVSRDYPDIAFENAGGVQTGDNMGLYTIKAHEGYYLAGVAAGMLTESNHLGFVAPFTVAKILRRINAFTIGARSVNSDVTTEVNWVNTWFDPSTEASAAQSLIDSGADVITNWTNSVASVRRAAENDVWAIGSGMSQPDVGGENYVTSVMANWESHHEETLPAVRDGEWEASFDWYGVEEGYIELDDWGPNVPSEVQSAVDDERTALVDGSTSIWSGTTFEEKGDDFMFQDVSSYVEGVQGSVPN